MLPAIGSIVYWIGVIVGAYVALRCVDILAADGANKRSGGVRGLAALVLLLVLAAEVMAFVQWHALTEAGREAAARSALPPLSP